MARPEAVAIGAKSSVSISADVLVTKLPPLPDEELLPPMEPGLATLWPEAPRMVGDEGVEGAVRVLSEKVVTDSCALLLCLFHKSVPVRVSALQDEVKPFGTDKKLSSDSSELFLVSVVLLRGVTGQTAVEARLVNNLVTLALLPVSRSGH